MRTYALTDERRVRWLYWLVALAASLWLGLLLLPSWLMTTHHVLPALVLYRVFALVCHQLPERSFIWHGYPLPICVRCTGIYLGFVLGWLISVRLSAMPRRWFYLALAPLIVDGILGVTGLWASTAIWRALTGVMAGGGLAWWLCSHRYFIVHSGTDSGETFLHG